MFTLGVATKSFDNFEKKDFLGLLLEIAKVDDDFSDAEKAVIDEFRQDIGVNAVPPKKDGSSYLEAFSAKDEKKRKAAFFGIYCVMMADGMVNEDEFSKLKKVQLAFDLPMAEYDEIIAMADRLNAIVGEITTMFE